MLGVIHADLLITVALVFLAHSATICRAENDLSLVKLPQWKEPSAYVAQCLYRQNGNLTCDWTSSQRAAPGDVKVKILKSPPLAFGGEACLEFWYLASGVSSGATLRALLKSSLGQVELWTSTPLPRDGWRQVSVPLNITEQGAQVIFEAVAPLSVDHTTLKQIGVRRGSCRNQCESNTELWTDDSTRCLCLVAQFFCVPSWCPKGQICDPLRDDPSRISPSGVCTIHSNTDCHTFDGVVFRFMSPCTYVLAKTCSASEPLPKFYVEVVNVYNDNGSLPTIQQINVDLGTFRVSLLKSETRRAVVNGVWKRLPLSLNNDTINVKSNPVAVVVGSSSGVSVSYDNTGAVEIRIPLEYSDRVCGLCGNFNQLPGDDLLKPDGTNAESATALAESWQTGGNVSSCETIKVPQQCNPLDKAHYSSEKYCGLLRSSSGPFGSCLPVVGAEGYFRACLLGLCSGHGDKVLCETLEAYADVCQKAGIDVPAWRNSTFCSLECDENSHYNSCASGCPEVCSSLDQTGLCGNCEERCECNPGFKFSGDKCVPAEDCGCWYKGKHYKRGATTVEGDCVQRCQCIGNDGMLCTAMKCASDEVCKEKNGIKDCFPFKPATCSVYGDPHYVTFDKLAYDFQGGCAYTLTTTCGGHATVQFTVIGFNIHPANQNFTRSKLEAVALQLGGLNLTLNQSGEVDVNGDAVRLPYSTNGSYGSVWVYVKKGYTILETTFGLKMVIDGQSRLFLQVDERFKYELCGLCGTYSGYQEDDFVMPGGNIAVGSFEFGNSWIMHANEGCTTHPNDPRECVDDEKNMANEECSMVFKGAFEACHEHVHPSIYFSSCVYDYCATSGNRFTLCESLKSYATACFVEGVELSHWQTGTPCDFTTAAPTIPASSSPIQNLCPISCNFDTNLCEWEQLMQDSFDWTRHSGSTPTNLTGPNQDHTTGAGFYMYLEGDNATHGDPARMLSPSCQLDGPICFHFWYYMYGSATSVALNIYQLQGTKATKIWSTMDNQGPEWHLGKADLKASGAIKVIIEGIRGSTEQSDVAIDDVAITPGSCSDAFPNLVGTDLPVRTTEITPPHPICNFACSFTTGLCTWTQMVTDAFDWTRSNGSTPTEMTGPSSDHTGDGHYIYIEASSVTYGDTARLISSECTDTGPLCLQFWYHMYGSADTMGLNIYLLQNKVAKAVWQKRNSQGNMWHLAQVDLNATEPFQILFEGRRGSNDLSDVAIDDITLDQGRCSDLSGLGEPEFNTTAIPTVNVLTTESPKHPVGNTTAHPSVASPTTAVLEHPMGNGTTPPSVASPTTAVLEPPMGNGTTPPSVASPTTAVLEPPMGNGTTPPSIASTATPEFPVLKSTAQVPALNVTTVPPTNKLTTVSNNKNTTKSPGQTHHPVCQLDCDFEQDLCQWSQLLTDVFDWERQNGSTPTSNTGPLSDHTTGGGHYLYIEANRASLGDTARLVSAECSDAGPQCLMFWYHMYGSADTMGIHVYLLQDRHATVVWRRRNDQGNMWHLAQVDLVVNGTFQIIFEGRRGSDDKSDVALDDIKLHQGFCQDLGKPANMSTTNAPQVPATTKPGSQPSPTAGQHPTVGGNVTAGPQVPATTKPVSSNETGPQPSPTAGPRPPTVGSNVTAGPQVPATTKPVSSNETGPQPSPTAGPQPPTVGSNVTAGPQVPATTKPVSSNETGPQPSPTAGPRPPTVGSNVTAGPQVTATTKPVSSNETGPQPSPTAGPRPPTAGGNVTAGPQVPATTKPVSSNETGPQPSPTAGPWSPTVGSNVTAGSQVPATTKPVSSNETGPQPSPTAGPRPPTVGSNVTAGPQVPATTKPVSSNDTGPQPSPTAGPQPPTVGGNVTAGPQVPATTKPVSSNETRPQPSPTAGPQPPTAVGNVTAGPLVPATTKPVSSNETGPQPSPTAGPQPPTAVGNVTAGPQVPATTKPVSSNETGPQPSPTAGPPPGTPHISTPSCAKNSHYTTCIPACSPTCKHLNGPPNCNAEKTCASGCVCDDGFAQKGSICLPVQKCGCMDRNGTYHNFKEVWYTDHCTQKCECEDDDDDEGKIDCEDKDGCEGDAVCLQHEMGQYYCESTGFGECTIQGDPEYKTFDKLKHDFSGSNLYVLVRTKNLPKNLPEIYIEGTNTCTDEDSQSDDSSEEGIDDDTEGHGQRLQELKIKVYNHTVELKHKRKVLVDGQRIQVPGSSAPGFEIKMQSSHIYLKTDFGLSVEFNGHCKTDIILPFLYKRRVEGLCGNFDGRKANDKVKPDGTIAKNTKEFGESWRV
ncbi:zonadhesin isoform X2 [Fundulus heteroclitus]|uniref:zonadhesin isoform X2 n=1 Tax=Fundulus heteroclitus TaxID=8078 RepID=UPI00165CE602|nr:zonadhesin isoform X2 [Fundulus heteroclitus]